MLSNFTYFVNKKNQKTFLAHAFFTQVLWLCLGMLFQLDSLLVTYCKHVYFLTNAQMPKMALQNIHPAASVGCADFPVLRDLHNSFLESTSIGRVGIL